MTDQAILVLFNERNEDAIVESRKKYGDYCYAIAYRILQSHEDAEECLNDTLLRAWNHIPPDCPNKLSAYLATIIRRLSLDCYRREQSQKRKADAVTVALHELEAILVHPDDPMQQIEERETARLLNQFLKNLPVKERSLLILRYFHLLTVAEIAKQCHMKENTVYAVLARTLKKLRIFLEKEERI